MLFSIIIPVFNRPDEVNDLLQSLCEQTCKEFEVVVVEDGSSVSSEKVVKQYKNKLAIKYLSKPNSGPADSRNFGAGHSQGDYLIFFDSDCIVPPNYFANVVKYLENANIDAFGGPDRAHESFTPVQKAISYAMTSFLTTGGIRGNGQEVLDRFFPRSFNMGIKRQAFNTLGGFSNMRFGEDIELSLRIFRYKFVCSLFPDAWVYHKRRTDFTKFFKQVYNSGIARINLYKRYPEALKAVHMLPALFTIGLALVLVAGTFFPWLWLLIVAYALAILISATSTYKNLKIGLLSVVASFVQLTGYGLGFISAWWRRCVLGKREYRAFEKTFYK